MMTTTLDIVAVEVPQDFSYEQLQDQRLRDWAMAAAGTIRSNISGAVQKVLEAGHLLKQAKERLPHGAYLPWVDRECQLKPSYAAKLIKAAALVNVEHVPHLSNYTDVATLFLLSADATTEDVREWFMERCAAGEVPSRAEVAARKRSAGQPRPPQPTETLALALIRKGEIERHREALALAGRSVVVTADQVMAELRLRELPKGSRILGADADFHRLKDGSWVRMPHAGRVDIQPEPQPEAETEAEIEPDPEPAPEPGQTICPPPMPTVKSELLTTENAANKLGVKVQRLRQALTPGDTAKRNGQPFKANGYTAVKGGVGFVRITPVDQ
jgi:hypothetical protein